MLSPLLSSKHTSPWRVRISTVNQNRTYDRCCLHVCPASMHVNSFSESAWRRNTTQHRCCLHGRPEQQAYISMVYPSLHNESARTCNLRCLQFCPASMHVHSFCESVWRRSRTHHQCCLHGRPEQKAYISMACPNLINELKRTNDRCCVHCCPAHLCSHGLSEPTY